MLFVFVYPFILIAAILLIIMFLLPLRSIYGDILLLKIGEIKNKTNNLIYAIENGYRNSTFLIRSKSLFPEYENRL